MKRLTKRDEFGNADIIGVDSADLQLNLEFKEFNKVTDALNKLAEYEDLEEQGVLIRLPCKVGDTVYLIDDIDNVFDRVSVVTGIEIDVDTVYIMISDGQETSSSSSYDVDDFGKTVFLTREEAFKKMQEDNAGSSDTE